MIKRLKDARRPLNAALGSKSHAASTGRSHEPLQTRSTGPSPTTWYAMRRSPLRANLVSGIPPTLGDYNPVRRAAPRCLWRVKGMTTASLGCA